jgi:hypothetical protein
MGGGGSDQVASGGGGGGKGFWGFREVSRPGMRAVQVVTLPHLAGVRDTKSSAFYLENTQRNVPY